MQFLGCILASKMLGLSGSLYGIKVYLFTDNKVEEI